MLQGAISLGRQLDYFKEYQTKVSAVAGSSRAAALTSGSIYVVSAGTSDYVQNYYVNAMLAATYTPEQFADALMTPFTAFVEVSIDSSKPSQFLKNVRFSHSVTQLAVLFDCSRKSIFVVAGRLILDCDLTIVHTT